MRDKEDPGDTPPVGLETATFRIGTFALHFGLSMLESPEGRRALIATGEDVLESLGRRGQRSIVYQGQGAARPVDDFLAMVRANLPTITVSTRVTGEGATIRVTWLEHEAADYNAKRAGQLRLNKKVSQS